MWLAKLCPDLHTNLPWLKCHYIIPCPAYPVKGQQHFSKWYGQLHMRSCWYAISDTKPCLQHTSHNLLLRSSSSICKHSLVMRAYSQPCADNAEIIIHNCRDKVLEIICIQPPLSPLHSWVSLFLVMVLCLHHDKLDLQSTSWKHSAATYYQTDYDIF